MTDGLWGSEFIISPTKQSTKKLLKKSKKPLKVEQQVKTYKKLSLEDNMAIVEGEVNRILGKFKDNICVLYSHEALVAYIDSAINYGEIAIDTETNRSLDPITCKLMGACIYVPGQKWAYVPVNHVNPITKEKLPDQVTEEQIKEQFDRLKDTKIIMHNGKFDYEVIHCTCNCDLDIYWDTIIGAKLLNENEEAGLKYQYISKIDPSIEKYNIEHLFKSIPYEYFSPELFALYAATDSYMTYELYKYQVKEFSKDENKALFSLFRTVEMPIVRVVADMELTGICLDLDRTSRLSKKWHEKLIPIEEGISKELSGYRDVIAEWRKTDEANYHPPRVGADGEKKSKSEQLSDPPVVTSPTQLSILLYDVLKVPSVDKKTPRGTGEEILKQLNIPLCNLILQKRGIEKLLGTYIDKLPECVNKKTGRVHASFNQLGAKTGRFSSNDPNLQNIPSHVKEIRTMFAPGYTEKDVQIDTDNFCVEINDEVELSTGEWVNANSVSVGDELFNADSDCIVTVSCVDFVSPSCIRIFINK